MPTRRDVLKIGGGAVVLAGLAASCSDTKSAGPKARAAAALASSPPSTRAAAPAFRPGGAGPLYWSTYGYENGKNVLMPEQVWKTNVDWVAATFADYGYKMVCTDGWIDHTQRITPNGYI